MERNAQRELSCIWFNCKYCKKVFPNISYLNVHKREFHKYEMLMAKGRKCVYNFDDGVVIFPARQNPNPNPNSNPRKTSVSPSPLQLQSVKTSQQKLLQHSQQSESQVPRQPPSPLVLVNPSRSLSPLLLTATRADVDFRSCQQSRSPNSDIFRRETSCTLRRTDSNDTDTTAVISTDEGEGELSIDIDCEELLATTETEIITELNSALLNQDQSQKGIKPRKSVITFRENTKKGNEVVVGNNIRQIRKSHNPPDSSEHFNTAATGTSADAVTGTGPGTATANVQQENGKKSISEITNRYGTAETKSSTRTPTVSPADRSRKGANEEAPDPDLDALEIEIRSSASASLCIAKKPAIETETKTGTGTGTERTNSKLLPISTSLSTIISPNNHHRHLPRSLQNPGSRKTFIKNEVTFYLVSDDSGHSGDGDGDEDSGEANCTDYNFLEDSNERENTNTKKISTTFHVPLLPDPVPVPVPVPAPVPVPVQLHPIPAQGQNNNICREQFPRQQEGNSSRKRSNIAPTPAHARIWDPSSLLQNYPRLELEMDIDKVNDNDNDNELEMDVEEEFSCDLCPRTFKKMGSLRRHKYSHYRHNVRSMAEGHRQNTERSIQRVYVNPARNQGQDQHQQQHRSNNTFGENRNRNRSHFTPIVSRSPCPRISFRQDSLATLIKKGGRNSNKKYEPPARRERGGMDGVGVGVGVDAAGREMEFEIEKLIRKENNLLGEMTEHSRARELADKLIQINRKQPPPPQSYPCLLCRLPFQSKESLAQHLEFHIQPAESSESEPEPPPPPLPTPPPPLPTQSGKSSYVCQICAGSFSSSSHFEEHKKGGKCWTNHTCAFCFLHFPTQDVLTTHERSHGGAKPFICKFCNADFESVGRLMSHLVSHSGAEIF